MCLSLPCWCYSCDCCTQRGPLRQLCELSRISPCWCGGGRDGSRGQPVPSNDGSCRARRERRRTLASLISVKKSYIWHADNDGDRGPTQVVYTSTNDEGGADRHGGSQAKPMSPSMGRLWCDLRAAVPCGHGGLGLPRHHGGLSERAVTTLGWLTAGVMGDGATTVLPPAGSGSKDRPRGVVC
jgi:hypothetical protein